MANLNDFFGGVFGDIFNPAHYEEILDNLWEQKDVKGYAKRLAEIKNDGFRVFRSDDGKHRVVKK